MNTINQNNSMCMLKYFRSTSELEFALALPLGGEPAWKGILSLVSEGCSVLQHSYGWASLLLWEVRRENSKLRPINMAAYRPTASKGDDRPAC